MTAAPADGRNGTLSVTGYGSRLVRVERISYGIEIYSEQAAASNGKVFYPGWLLDSDFSIGLLHLNIADRDGFNRWMQTYMEKVTSGNLSHGAMLVQVPVRDFARSAIPMGELGFGDSVQQQSGKAYRTTLVFRGATDPMSPKLASSFQKAKNGAADSAPYYPSTGQKKGAESLDGTIFDDRPPNVIDRLIGSGSGSTRISRGAGGA